MTIKNLLPEWSTFGKALLGGGALCLTLLVAACGGNDDKTPSASETANAACTAAHCAPAP
ncbi:hypothetical protein [Paraburkholderia bannensis]|uniref:hypothetical protein n=1 Tax=Paraburkholderia bannensis TaxID=765414 RepID=UPI002ABDE1CB|nr:hypothetical protein [Paraburkholderia bannensis]